MLFWVTHQISLPTLIKILSRELLRFPSNAKSQSVKKKKKISPWDRSTIPPWLLVMFPQFTSSQNAHVPPKLLGLGVSPANENQAVFFFPLDINNGQITKCRFWSWHIYCGWWCLNGWPTAPFSRSWEGSAGEKGRKKKNFWFWLIEKQLDKHDMTWMSECIMQPHEPRWDWRMHRHE